MPENPADHCRNPAADAALRRIARDSGAVALCDHPHCRRGRRCRGPWLWLLPETPAALPLCLFIKVGRDLAEARAAALRLAELGERIKDVFMEEDAFPEPEDAARRVAALIETDVMKRMAEPGPRRRA